jgi:hypothetical protein
VIFIILYIKSIIGVDIYLSLEKDLEKTLEKSVEKGIEKGIIKAVEKLIDKCVFEAITQSIIDVIASNLIKALETGLIIEELIKIISKSQTQQIQSVILKFIESKYGKINDSELINDIKSIQNFDNLDTLLKNIQQLESIESTKQFIKTFNSCT